MTVSTVKQGNGPGSAATAGGPPEAVVPLTAIHPIARVDLMPSGVHALRRFRRARGWMALAVLATAAAAGLLFLVSARDVAAAQEELAAEQARATALQSQAAQYAEVPALLATIDRSQAALSTAMGTEIAWYPYLDDLSRSAPESVWFEDVTFAGLAGAQPETDPLADPTAVASVTMRGGALAHEDVVAWLAAMSDLVTWNDPSFTQSAYDPGTTSSITFDTSARFSSDAFTRRFADGLPLEATQDATPDGSLDGTLDATLGSEGGQ